ncbi:MAG TPA: FtsX-like permease family protein [bacterium]|nr:FtsX-like permease family protein [bacterium]
MGYPWFIAKRYFKAKHRFAFISIISKISVAGLAIGIAALIITVSILAGFGSALEQKIIGFDGHIRLRYYLHQPMGDIPIVLEDLKSFTEIQAASPFISHEAMIRSGNFTDGVMVEGMSERTLDSLLTVGQFLKTGALDFSVQSGLPGMILSRRLSQKIHAEVGEKITLFSVDGIPGPRNHPRFKQFRVSGIFHTGMSDYDDVYVYTSLAASQDLFKLPDQAHGIIIKLHNTDHVESFAMQLQKELGYPFFAETWYDRHASLFAWFRSQQFPIVIVFGLIALVAVFNIMSTLMMIVIEKTRNIGILKALGSKDNEILRIFIWNGLLIGLFGALLGSSLSLLLGFVQQHYQVISIPAEVYFMESLPIEFHWEHFVIINGAALFFAIIATVYPALQASRREPVETIVHE